MRNVPSFNALIESAIVSNWDKGISTDYRGASLQYHGVARKIEKKHIMFEKSNLKHDNKTALCDHNSAIWTCTFPAIVVYGYGPVVMPIRHEVANEQIYNIVNQSESKLLFVGDEISATLAVVNEGYIPQKGDKLVGLVDLRAGEVETLRFSTADLLNVMEQNRMEMNARLPSCRKTKEIEFHDRKFENTSKNQSNDFYIITKYSYWAAC